MLKISSKRLEEQQNVSWDLHLTNPTSSASGKSICIKSISDKYKSNPRQVRDVLIRPQ